jgi:hypothetical protein
MAYLRTQNVGQSKLGLMGQALRAMRPVALAPSQPGGTDPAAIGLPAVNFTPAGATAVDEMGDLVIAAGASGVLLQYQIPESMTLRIAGIGFGADDETSLAFLSWSAQLNGDPYPGYSFKPTAVGSLRNLTEIFITAGSSALFSIVGSATLAAVLPYRYIARIRGWLYSEKEAG